MVYLNDSMAIRNIPEQASVLPYASVLSSNIKDKSGLNQSYKKGQLSTSRSPSDVIEVVSKSKILIVDDNPADVLLMRRALKLANIDAELHIVEDGEKATQYFDEIDIDLSMPCLDLILLDINLPKKQGSEVIRHLRSKDRGGQTLVLIVSSSDSLEDQNEMTRYGASGFFQKPSNFNEYMKLGPKVQRLLSQKN